jgi:hypothetical protein
MNKKVFSDLDQSMANLKKGKAGKPIELNDFKKKKNLSLDWWRKSKFVNAMSLPDSILSIIVGMIYWTVVFGAKIFRKNRNRKRK